MSAKAGIEMQEMNNNNYSSLSGIENGTQQHLNVKQDAIQMPQVED